LIFIYGRERLKTVIVIVLHMPPKPGTKQKYATALRAFLKEAEVWLEESDSVWIFMARDLARDLDENGTTATLLNQFSKVISRLESKKPKPEPVAPEAPPVERDQLDLFLEDNGL
jgi:hypothetical protein